MRLPRWFHPLAFILILVMSLLAGLTLTTSPSAAAGLQPVAEATQAPAPALTHSNAAAWLNSKPLSWADFRGKVVLVDVWTYGCWNCYRSIPWLQEAEQRFGAQGLRVLGVHTPEFEHERERKNVERKLTEFKITHPVMLDNDHSYWNALGNRYWPAFYLVDRQGRIRARFIGETHAGDRNARAMEQAITELLAET